MQNKEYIAALRSTIEWLEEEQSTKREQLKERFHETYESLKPMSLLKSTLKGITRSSTAMDAAIGPLLGLVAGHLTKRIVVGKSENATRQVIGAALQVGVAELVTQNQGALRSVGKFAWRFVFGRRKPTPPPA